MQSEDRYAPLDINPDWNVEAIERARWILVRKREETLEKIASMLGQIQKAEAALVADGTRINPKWRAACGSALKMARRDRNLIESDIVRLKNLKAEKTGATKDELLILAIKTVLTKEQREAVFSEFYRLRNAV